MNSSPSEKFSSLQIATLWPAMAQFSRVQSPEVRAAYPACGVAMVHRVGRLGVGEISVAVAVSCPHRAEAFAAARSAIDAVKERVPVWKKDIPPAGPATWVDPTAGLA